MGDTQNQGTPAGWYDDGSGRQRYWDGERWTDQFAPEPAAQNASGAGAAPPPAGPPAASAPAKGNNVLAIVALVVAVVGFIFACIPGALIVGWVLLPIAFILAIVAFFLKGRKWPAVVALVLSVVGTIVGVIVFTAVVATSFDDAFGGSEVSVSPPADPDDSGDVGDDEGEDDADEAGSTREHPVPLGTKISGDEYDVVVNSFTIATDEVLGANPFNEAPPEGSEYAVINLTVTYTGEDSGNSGFVAVDYVTAGGNVVDVTSGLAVPPEPALNLQELFTGASATGNKVLAVPVDDHGVLRIRPGLIADEVFVATE